MRTGRTMEPKAKQQREESAPKLPSRRGQKGLLVRFAVTT